MTGSEAAMNEIYLDYAAGAPLRPEALRAMEPYMGSCGNPNAAHTAGRRMRAALEDARARVAACLHAEASEIFFTSGGTESDAWAVHIGEREALRRGGRMLTSPIEHHAVLRAFEMSAKRGLPVGYLPVAGTGAADPGGAEEMIGDDTAFVSLMAANNETGVIQPVEAVCAAAKKHGALFHTDAVQAVGSMGVDVKAAGCDYLSASAHKFGGPNGVGFLYINKKSPRVRLIAGGAQESNLRAGTQNMAGAVGLAAALEAALGEDGDRVRALRDELEGILLRFPGAVIHGREGARLKSITNVCFPRVPAAALLPRLDMNGVFASAGAACTAGAAEVSHVLRGMGLGDDEARCSMRFSVGSRTTREEILRAGEIVLREASMIREISLRSSN